MLAEQWGYLLEDELALEVVTWNDEEHIPVSTLEPG